MRLDQAPRDEQAEAEAADRARDRAVSLTETLEDVRQEAGIDAAAGIPHADVDRTIGSLDGHGDGAARRRELHRVSEQVDEHLLEAVRIGDDQHLGQSAQPPSSTPSPPPAA